MVAWRAEGGAYRNSPIKMTSTAGLERFDLGALIVVSKEVLEDESFNAEATIRDQLVKALAAQLDADFISPSNSGTGGTKPASITSGAGANASPTESMFDFSDAFSGVPNNAWIIINPWQAARLYGAARPDIRRSARRALAGAQAASRRARAATAQARRHLQERRDLRREHARQLSGWLVAFPIDDDSAARLRLTGVAARGQAR